MLASMRRVKPKLQTIKCTLGLKYIHNIFVTFSIISPDRDFRGAYFESLVNG